LLVASLVLVLVLVLVLDSCLLSSCLLSPVSSQFNGYCISFRDVAQGLG
jgi:hypothetical protein